MGRSPCCDKVGLKKGPWTPEEDQKLLAYIEEYGHGSWRALPAKAGLQRCGKSCRLRWTNYLRPDIKRGKFSLQEEQTIIQLHALLGNRWSAIATHLPKRTDNEIKNYWNTHLKKRLMKMGIDPVTHKPKTDALGSGSCNPKDAANLSHMAQWESARLEAEARLVRESNLVTNPLQHQLGSSSSSTTTQLINKPATGAPPRPLPLPCLDVLKAWQGAWTKRTRENCTASFPGMMDMDDLESPTSTLNFPDSSFPVQTVGFGENAVRALEFSKSTVLTCESSHGWKLNQQHQHQHVNMPELKERLDNNTAALHDMPLSYGCTDGNAWFIDSFRTGNDQNVSPLPPISNIMEGLADMFAYNSTAGEQNSSVVAAESSDNGTFEENKSYWNSILNNLVNTSSSGSPVF
ncbi:transcription factor MYB16 [Ziziphus jujuba]|uniref:Transcription factor MYB16 n=2 Tax=Ziziphus jujuba TaxID=326968 RepID=A0A6P4AE15_ZIZJJ|nr:transcription factor MYB16 [Ziziphus jujuba]KAH7515978.1 hypothetical protein FEM48_Zijuj10G0085700 [Ziziphus jujuba var. spinosa]